MTHRCDALSWLCPDSGKVLPLAVRWFCGSCFVLADAALKNIQHNSRKHITRIVPLIGPMKAAKSRIRHRMVDARQPLNQTPAPADNRPTGPV